MKEEEDTLTQPSPRTGEGKMGAEVMVPPEDIRA